VSVSDRCRCDRHTVDLPSFTLERRVNTMKPPIASVLIILSLNAGACRSSDDESNHAAGRSSRMVYMSALAAPSLSRSTAASVRVSHPLPRMVMRSATVTCEVEDYVFASVRMERIFFGNGGYVVSSSYGSGDDRAKAGRLVGRLPSAAFDQALDSIAAAASIVLSRSVEGEDITEEFVDISARLENKRKVEARYREILRTARTVKDILEVEGALSTIREEIDELDGRSKFLSKRTELASITIDLREPRAVATVAQAGFWVKVKEGFRDGVAEFSTVLGLTITFLIASIPVIIVLGVLVFGVRSTVRRMRPLTSHRADRGVV
jgi:hypothetical protein